MIKIIPKKFSYMLCNLRKSSKRNMLFGLKVNFYFNHDSVKLLRKKFHVRNVTYRPRFWLKKEKIQKILESNQRHFNVTLLRKILKVVWLKNCDRFRWSTPFYTWPQKILLYFSRSNRYFFCHYLWPRIAPSIHFSIDNSAFLGL